MSLDEQYLVGVQDVDVPTWTDDIDIAAMQNVEDPNDEFDQRQPTSIRKADGGLDFLNGVTEGLAEMSAALLATPAPARKAKPRLDTIRTKEVASDKWRGGNFTIGVNPVQIATESPQRRTITIVNRTSGVAIGTGHVYLSSLPSVAGAPNTFQLQFDAFIYNPVVLNTKDNVWAVCGTGDGAILDVIEEFDMES